MTDIASTARTARESLSRGLSALQSDPNVPPHLLELAGTIAQAMGALHQIERSNGTQTSPFAQTALTHLRAALTQLQSQPQTHPTVALAMEAVAGALGTVHALSKLAEAPAPVAPQPAAPPATAQMPPHQAPAPAPAAAAPPPAAPQKPQAHADPFAAAPAAAKPQAAGPAAVVNSQRPPAPAPLGDAQVIEADLGTHSPTNFYKGLAGNDVIDHGGLFVSTYMIPKLGLPVRLRVSMPGGYEFEANAVVRWKREAGGDAAPGFGAQLTEISPEARQLVYRYVKNREPIFYDDF